MKIKLFPKHVVGMAIAVLCLVGIPSPFNSQAQTQPTLSPPDTSTESSALPPNILPTSPLAQVIRLAQSGVDESVIITYVTNSGSTFNLNSDEIIYLKDIGLPNEVVTAMMQRDQQLQQQMTATTYQPPAQPAPETTEQPEPVPVEQPAEVTVNYFYDNLALYGNWVDVDGYGRCWRPSVVVYPAGSRIAITDIGSIPIAAGIGLRIIPGVRQRFTMVVGFGIRAGAGAGRRTPFGVRHG
jgi:hypothetical protein